MSDSYHVTIKDIRGLSVRELEEQSKDSNSDLSQWAEKRRVKREKIKARKSETENNEPL